MPDLQGFVPLLKRGAIVDRRINTVRDLIDSSTYGWKKDLIREMFEDQSTEAILNLKLFSTPQSDVPRWLLNRKGVF